MSRVALVKNNQNNLNVSHLSQQFGLDPKRKSSFMHLFIIGNKEGLCDTGACNENTVESTRACFSSNINALAENGALRYYLGYTADEESNLFSIFTFAREARTHCGDFYDSNRGDYQFSISCIYSIKNGSGGLMETQLLIEKGALLSSPWSNHAFNNDARINNKPHRSYSLFRILRTMTVGSSSDADFMSLRICDKDIFGCFMRNSSSRLCNSRSTVTNRLTINDSFIVSPNNDYRENQYVKNHQSTEWQHEHRWLLSMLRIPPDPTNVILVVFRHINIAFDLRKVKP